MNTEFQSEMWPTEKVRPYEHNPRKIPQKAIAKVASSIKEFGWRQPIVVDQAGVIVVGHVRYLAARKLGMDQVPVHVAAGLTAEQVRAYRLMDNRSHEETDWDPALLTLEIAELKALEFDLNFTGFEPREIDEFLTNADADEAANQFPRDLSRSRVIYGAADRIACCTAMPPIVKMLHALRATCARCS
jgi:ParB-like chromosome segregation protein Spo0J